MNLALNDEQKLLRESVQKFATQDFAPSSRRDLRADCAGFRSEDWSRFEQAGWLTLPFAVADGGAGGGVIDTMVLLQELGRALLLEPYIPSIVLAGGLVQRLGTADQRAAYLGPLMKGARQATIAMLEPQKRFDLEAVEMRAVQTPAGFSLTGRKTAVWHAASADWWVVSARTAEASQDDEGDGITLFLVDAQQAGIERHDRVCVDGHRSSELRLCGVQLKKSAVLGTIGRATPALVRLTDEALVALGAEALGSMLALHAMTLDYAKTRRQFGRAIGSFQALQHRLVDMFIACERVQSLLIRAVIEASAESEDASLAASALKVGVGQAGRFVAQQAIQLHGGMGMTDEVVVGHYFKRLACIDAQFGNADYHLQRFATLSR